jgi:hypothetical protein
VETGQEYRRYAAECRLLAEQVLDPNDRVKLIALALAWARLAAWTEREGHADRPPCPSQNGGVPPPSPPPNADPLHGNSEAGSDSGRRRAGLWRLAGTAL